MVFEQQMDLSYKCQCNLCPLWHVRMMSAAYHQTVYQFMWIVILCKQPFTSLLHTYINQKRNKKRNNTEITKKYFQHFRIINALCYIFFYIDNSTIPIEFFEYISFMYFSYSIILYIFKDGSNIKNDILFYSYLI